MLERVTNPVRIIVDTTRKCNLDCWYCHSTSGPFYKGPELGGDDLRNIFEGAEKARTFDITLTGGEPTMWKGLIETISASKDLEYPALQLITNATLIDERRLKTLRSGNLKRILVSLDGQREIHEVNRGRNSFERTIKGVQALREIVDNITVISVIDRTNFDRWPELTASLVEMGVKQHHLSPVCFAGGAMELYKGLTGEQFEYVRQTVNRLALTLPQDFTLVFNDILIYPPDTRSLPINSFGERFKGWHFVIRPDGKVNVAVRAWGRSWRENETLGNIKEKKLTEIMEKTVALRELVVGEQFDPVEETRRKFHLDNPAEKEIESDRADVKSVEEGTAEPIYSRLDASKQDRTDSEYENIFYLPLPNTLQEISRTISSQPNRYRLRKERGFGFLFDRQTFNITILTEDEINEINKNLSGV